MRTYATLSGKVNHCEEVETYFENPAVLYFWRLFVVPFCCWRSRVVVL